MLHSNSGRCHLKPKTLQSAIFKVTYDSDQELLRQFYEHHFNCFPVKTSF